ncbi:MAG TPA: transglycosylase SLT domain-containing protein [Solirubrobacteraceae bacterium]|nr:transglycosylase SLT domain-containing protein [Solirubrobacteraceae bacterium]
MPRPPSARQVRRRRFVALAALIAVALVALVVIARGGGEKNERLVPGGGDSSGEYDPLAYDSGREDELVRRATTGLSDVVYEKSPGGVVATARRTAHWRPLAERSARAYGVNPDTLEAIVFLESAGRPDVVAGGDLEGAVGLTQILASTATDLLGLHVDIGRSRSLTSRIARSTSDRQIARLYRARRKADQRFDPKFSLEAAARYLKQAKDKFGRDDLAVATYHMGMGNLDTILKRYGDNDPSYARLYFDSAPMRKPSAYALLSSLGDDSSTYYWKVRAAQEIMRLYRDDPKKLGRLAGLDESGGAGARRLYPNGAPESEAPKRTPPGYLATLGLRLRGDARSDYAPDPGTESVLVYLGAGAKAISGQVPLTVTSAHGIRIEVLRRYQSRKQALAFEYLLDRLQAWNLIAWGRGETTLAIVVSPDATKVLPKASKLARDALREPKDAT